MMRGAIEGRMDELEKALTFHSHRLQQLQQQGGVLGQQAACIPLLRNDMKLAAEKQAAVEANTSFLLQTLTQLQTETEALKQEQIKREKRFNGFDQHMTVINEQLARLALSVGERGRLGKGDAAGFSVEQIAWDELAMEELNSLILEAPRILSRAHEEKMNRVHRLPAKSSRGRRRDHENGQSSEADSLDCIICSKSFRRKGHHRMVLLPCGHANCCFVCVSDLDERNAPCPTCRGEISGVVKCVLR